MCASTLGTSQRPELTYSPADDLPPRPKPSKVPITSIMDSFVWTSGGRNRVYFCFLTGDPFSPVPHQGGTTSHELWSLGPCHLSPSEPDLRRSTARWIPLCSQLPVTGILLLPNAAGGYSRRRVRKQRKSQPVRLPGQATFSIHSP